MVLSIGQQLTSEERLERSVFKILTRIPEIAGVLMLGTREVSYDEQHVPTACTNGRDEWYGDKFMKTLNDPAFRFVVIHEVYHKIYRHTVTWRHLYDRRPRLANIACDYVINHQIWQSYGGDGWIEMPDGICYDERFAGMDTAQVYNILDKEFPEKEPPHTPEGQPVPGTGKCESEKDSPGNTPSNESGGNKASGDDTDDDLPTTHDHLDWEGAKEIPAEEQRELENQIDEALRQGAIAAGKSGSGGSRNGFDELLKPQVDWREVLSEFIKLHCSGNDMQTWARPNRRFISTGFYLPSGISERVEELAVHIDTSGSIGSREINMMLTEVVSVCDMVTPDKIRITYWDTSVLAVETYEMHELDTIMAQTQPEGGGGTDVRCVPVYLKENGIRPQASIVLTDGYLWGGWGDWDHDVLWCVLDNENAKPDVGKVVHIKSHDM